MRPSVCERINRSLKISPSRLRIPACTFLPVHGGCAPSLPHGRGDAVWGGNAQRGGGGGSSAHRQHPTAKAAWLSLFIPLLFRNYGVPWQPPDTLWPPDAGPRMGAGALGRAGGSETPSCLVFPWVEDGVKDHQRGCAGPRQRVLRSTVISAAPSAQSLLRAQ